MIEIIVRISPEGEAEVEVKGHKGSGCQALTRDLERALGETGEDRRTAEFFQTGERPNLRLGRQGHGEEG